MFSTRILGMLVLVTLPAPLGAQTRMATNYPLVGTVGDLTHTGILINGVTNDSEHNIVTTVGNPLFPAGNVRISNNGVVVAGATSGDVAPVNTPIPAVGLPPGIPPGAGAILPLWDDLSPSSPTDMIFWKEENGVLKILWTGESVCCPGMAAATVTFQVNVFATPAAGAPWIQILYDDTIFSHGSSPGIPVFNSPCDFGACATIGYVANPAFGNNVQWSLNTDSLVNVLILSIFQEMELIPSSPLGPGSLKLDFVSRPWGGGYFLAVTAAPGVFPNGWFFGLDIAYSELAYEIATGPPFTGPLNSMGNASLGPLQGVPPLTLHAVALGFTPASSVVPVVHTAPVSYAIP